MRRRRQGKKLTSRKKKPSGRPQTSGGQPAALTSWGKNEIKKIVTDTGSIAETENMMVSDYEIAQTRIQINFQIKWKKQIDCSYWNFTLSRKQQSLDLVF